MYGARQVGKITLIKQLIVYSIDKSVKLSAVHLIIHATILIRKRRSLVGSMIGGIAETQEMLDYCAKYNILCDIELISASEINTAFERILTSDVKYRFVIDISTI